MLNRQSAPKTGLQHPLVQIDTIGRKAGILQQFKPFAATTTYIQGRSGFVDLTQRLDERQIDLEPLAYQITRATVTIFKRAVKPV